MAFPRLSLFAASLTLALALAATPVSAHEQFTAGTYTIEVGWLYEPPVADQPNAITISIHTGGADGVAVTDGVSLVPEVQLGSNSKTLSTDASDDEPGLYSAAIVPTEAGDYTVHITGNINGQQVDHTTKLQTVIAPGDNAFPSRHGTIKQLEDHVSNVEMASWALGGAGVVLGLVALIVAFSRRRPATPEVVPAPRPTSMQRPVAPSQPAKPR